jgi:predicted ATPase
VKGPSVHRSSAFVDRTWEITQFESLIRGSAQRIMCICGPAGIGKTSLIKRMIEECKRQEVRCVYVGWEDSKRYSYLDVMREIRDEVNEPLLFQLFNDRVNFYFVPDYVPKIILESSIKNVQVLPGGEIQRSGTVVHIGHEVKIEDLEINIPRPDRDVTEEEVIIQCTRAFMLCLRALASENPLMIFLDAVEKADRLTVKWIWNDLLVQVRDQEIPNLFIVIAKRGSFELHPAFFNCTELCELQPFQIHDILEYMSKRDSELIREETLAKYIFAEHSGNPLKIAQSIDNFIRFKRRQRSTNE